MKKIIPFLVLICFANSSFSQEIKVKKIKKLPVEEKAYFPDFGRNHREILLSDKHHKGLSLYKRCWRKETEITDASGAGSRFHMEDNGNIVFSETHLENGKKTIEYKRYISDEDRVTEISSAEEIQEPVRAEGKKIILNSNNTGNKTLAPVGDKYYIWTSLSPEKDKILFTAAGDGSYISDLEGNILQKLGYLNAPEWLNNEWVIGMNDKDDGKKILSSDIIAVHAGSGERFNLTEKTDVIAQYPKPSPEQNRIIYHSLDGEIYLMKIKIKE